MAEGMPTDEDIARYVQSIYASPTGSTPSNRLNFLQDMARSAGLDPFGLPFEEEPFPLEMEIAPTRVMYGSDPGSPYRSIFDAIDRGADPISATRQVIDDPSQPFGDPAKVRDEGFDKDLQAIATSYARELQDIESQKADWGREQARKRAEAPVTLQEILFPRSQYQVVSEAAGKPEGLTVDDMLGAYNRSRFERAETARQRGLEQRAARQPAPVDGPRPAGRRGSGGLGGVFRMAGRAIGNIPVVGALPPGRLASTVIGAGQYTPSVLAIDAVTRAITGGSGGGKPGKVAPAAIPQQRKVSDFRVGPTGSVADLIYRDAARRAQEQQRSTPAWTQKQQNVMNNIALLNMLGGGQ